MLVLYVSRAVCVHQVTDHANAAMLHFHMPHVADQLALQSFMVRSIIVKIIIIIQ